MARIRTIKPEFFTSDDIVSMSPLARLFYVSLWCEADREGRLAWNANTLKMRYLPGDDADINDIAQELIERGHVRLYEIDGKTYAVLPTFSLHQVINNRERPSAIPAPTDDAFCDAPFTRGSVVKAEGKGRKEGKGKEGNGKGNTRPDDATGTSPVFSAKSALISEGVPDTIAGDYLKIRKAKKAPFTATALEGLKREATKAGMSVPDAVAMCCERGWQGFRAEWLASARDKVTRPSSTNNHTNFQEKTYVGTPDDEIDWLNPGDGQGGAGPAGDDLPKARRDPVS